MKRVLEWIIAISFVATFSVNIIMAWEDTITFVSIQYYNLGGYLGTVPTYKFDLFKYISNLNQAFTSGNTMWSSFTNYPTGTIGLDMPHNMIVIVNWLIYGANLLLTPFRALAYGGKLWLAIFGINLYATNAPFLVIIKNLMEMIIPYIPY